MFVHNVSRLSAVAPKLSSKKISFGIADEGDARPTTIAERRSNIEQTIAGLNEQLKAHRAKRNPQGIKIVSGLIKTYSRALAELK